MSDWHPQVVLIEKVEHHPNADSLDLVTVLGDYPVVVKRDQFKVNDKANYIPIDSIVPDTEEYYFLCPVNREQYEENGEVKSRILGSKYPLGSVPEKNRVIKAKKIRNLYSQGMLTQVTHDLNVGDSIVELLDLKKVIEEEEDNIQMAKKAKGANAAPPPKGWAIPYYDLEGIRKYLSCFVPGEEVVVTEKLHGSNASFCFDGEQLHVKSRNFYKKFDVDDPWWDAAIRLDLVNKLKAFPMKVFFGELIGSVKNFRYDCQIVSGKLETKVRFFDVYDPKTNRYADFDDFKFMVESIGLETVPILYKGPWLTKEEMYAFAEGSSTLAKHIREGVVIKPVKERFEPRLNSRLALKLIGEGYALQK